jgi:hypothetical protein
MSSRDGAWVTELAVGVCCGRPGRLDANAAWLELALLATMFCTVR